MDRLEKEQMHENYEAAEFALDRNLHSLQEKKRTKKRIILVNIEIAVPVFEAQKRQHNVKKIQTLQNIKTYTN